MANDDTQNVVLDFKMNGQVQFANTVKDINTIMNTASKQFKAQVAAMDENASTSERLAAEQQKLQIQSEAAAKRTQMLTEQLQKMKDGGQTSGAAFDRLVGKIADAQRVETNLKTALDGVNAQLTEHGQKANAARDELSGLQQEENELDQKMKLATSSAKLENAQLANGASDAQKNEAAHRQLASQLGLAQQKVENLKNQLNNAKTAFGENSSEATAMRIKLNEAETTVANLGNEMNNLGQKSGEAGDKLDEIAQNTAADKLQNISSGLQSAGQAVQEFNAKAQEAWGETDDAVDNLTSKTGATGEAADKLAESYEAIVDSMPIDDTMELSNAMAGVQNQFDASGSDLTKITTAFMQFSAVTGQDASEAVTNIHDAMQKFNISAIDAPKVLDAFTAASQRTGVPVATLEEQVAKAYPTFKQLNIGLTDGVTLLSVWTKSGLDSSTALKGMQKALTTYAGEHKSLKDGLTGTYNAIKNAKTAQDAYSAGVAAFGAKAGPQMTQAILDNKVNLADLQVVAQGTGGTLKNTYEQTLDPVDKAKVAQQQFSEVMAKVGGVIQESLLPVIKKLLPVVQQIGDAFAKAPAPLKTAVVLIGAAVVALGAMAPVITAVATVLPLFGVGATAAGAGAGAGAVGIGALMTALLPIIGVIAAVIAAITAVVLVIKNWGTIVTWLKGVWSTLLTFFQPILAAVRAQLQAFQPVLTVFKQYFSNTINNIKLALNGFISVVRGILNILVGVFTGNGAKIKAGFQAVFQGLVNIGAAALRQVINTVASGFAAVVNTVSAVFGKARGIVSAVWSAIKGFFSSGLSSILGTVSRVFGSIVNAISHPMETAKSLVSRAIQAIKGFFNFHISWPHIPLPHFSLSGKFNPLKGQIPHVAVDWYAQGAIMTQPTMFGMNNGRAQVGGEAGPEGVIPLTDNTWDKMGAAIAAHMPGQGPIYLQVDGTTFARLMNGYFDAVGGNVMSLQDRGLTQ